MTRYDAERLDDITRAIAAVKAHLLRGSLSDELIADAVRMRIVEIGEAVKALSDETKAAEPDIAWQSIARMRDLLTHRYFMTDLSVIQRTVDDELDPLLSGVQRLRTTVDDERGSTSAP